MIEIGKHSEPAQNLINCNISTNGISYIASLNDGVERHNIIHVSTTGIGGGSYDVRHKYYKRESDIKSGGARI